MGKRSITHVIFDVDGLILDTEKLYTEVSTEVCAQYGKQYTWELKARLMGQKEHVAAQMIIDSLGLPLTPDELLQKLFATLSVKFLNCDLLPGADRLIRHLHKHNVPICVATGSNNENFNKKTNKHQELFSLFHHIVIASDDPEVEHSKPAPDCFQVAARRFENVPKPEQTLVFEDAPNGVNAGLAAGMAVVWVPDVRADRSGFEGKVDLILQSLEDFKPEDFGLPPFDDVL